MPDLHYVPREEFTRLDGLGLSAVARARLFATLCRINTLYLIARAGSGHIGSSFSSMDIVSWLYLNELRHGAPGGSEPRDIYFSSKGHDAPGQYAVLLALGRLPFEMIHTLRRLGGLPGHPDVTTPGMEANTGPLGMGISKAKGMVLANRRLGVSGKVYVMTGDGELQEGQIWESLLSAANLRMAELTVVVDHNKIQSDTWVSAVGHLGDLEAKFNAFGWEVARCDGHDLQAFAAVLAHLRTVSDRPKVVIADTIKGCGVSFMQHTAMGPGERYYRFHSGAPDDDSYARALAELIASANEQLAAASGRPIRTQTAPRPARAIPPGAQRLVAAYSRELIRHAEQNPRLMALDADLVLDCGLIPFQERFPEQFVECGISEQDMVSQAGGMALRGLLPVVHSFACFLSTRPNEQIYNNATERKKVVYVASLAGLLPGGPGHSHQSVRDISALGAVPGLIMLEPSCEAEVALAVEYCLVSTKESCYLRLVSIPCQVPYQLPSNYTLEPGKGAALTEGEDAILFGYGPVLLPQAYSAAGILAQRGFGLRVTNLPWLNRVDDDWLVENVRGYDQIFTLDDHYLAGGQGEMLARRLAELGIAGKARVKRFGVTDIPACGQNDEVLRAHGLDAESLANAILAPVRRRGVGTGSHPSRRNGIQQR